MVLFQVSTNGIISIGKPITEFIPRLFPTNDTIIAPFWGDVDTSNGAGTITFGSTMNATQLRKVREQIVAAFPEQGLFMPLYLFIVTWDSVGYFDRKSDLVCAFPKLSAPLKLCMCSCYCIQYTYVRRSTLSSVS